FGTVASQFNDPGTNGLFIAVMERLATRAPELKPEFALEAGLPVRSTIIPPERVRYLAEIASSSREPDAWAREQTELAQRWFQLEGAIDAMAEAGADDAMLRALTGARDELLQRLDPDCRSRLEGWDELVRSYSGDEHEYVVRGKPVRVPQATHSLSGLRI